MESILFTKNDLTSNVNLPADIRKMLSFIANWDYDCELALWFDDIEVYIYQPEYGLWTLFEAMKFNSDLITAGIITDSSAFLFSSEEIHCPSCDYEEYVTALCIRRYYIK